MGEIDEANQRAIERIESAEPMLIGVNWAREVIPDMDNRTLLHSGPPVTWERMSSPQKGGIIGAMLYEGWAATPEEAARMAEKGEIEFSPCHQHTSVGPMAGIVSPSMPVYVVENRTGRNRAYCNFNEGLGKVLRYGAYSEEVIERLEWMRDEMAPLLMETLKVAGPIDLFSIMARALQMGDELHCRNVAATMIFVSKLLPAMIDTGFDKKVIQRTANFMNSNDMTFLQLTMASCKAAMDAGHDVPYSTIVTAMSRNGTDFGIRVSGLPDSWFTAPAPTPKTLFFPGFREGDEGKDMGDSAITETMGLGNFACICAPAVVQVVGGSVRDAENFTREMREITVARHKKFTMPYLNFENTSLGIDIRKVVETGIAPSINTGVAHKDAGVGGVGFGLVRAPMECFEKAIKSFAERYLQA